MARIELNLTRPQRRRVQRAMRQTPNIHQAQLLTYLRLSQSPLGLLLNFNVPVLKEGITRLVNGFPDLCATSASSASQR